MKTLGQAIARLSETLMSLGYSVHQAEMSARQYVIYVLDVVELELQALPPEEAATARMEWARGAPILTYLEVLAEQKKKASK